VPQSIPLQWQLPGQYHLPKGTVVPLLNDRRKVLSINHNYQICATFVIYVV
jgi:hypothetical protein